MNYCLCGERLPNVIIQTHVCKVCSSVYDNNKNLIPSRHNWNYIDYFSSFKESKNFFNVGNEGPELKPSEE